MNSGRGAGRASESASGYLHRITPDRTGGGGVREVAEQHGGPDGIGDARSAVGEQQSRQAAGAGLTKRLGRAGYYAVMVEPGGWGDDVGDGTEPGQQVQETHRRRGKWEPVEGKVGCDWFDGGDRVGGCGQPADEDVGEGGKVRDEVGEVGKEAFGVACVVSWVTRQGRAENEFARVVEDGERAGAGGGGQDQGGDEAGAGPGVGRDRQPGIGSGG